MQENEFEKQVKNMMEEFQLSPLDTAWEKVSRRIKEDKRKKRYFIFLLFFGLMAAGFFGYFISERNTKQLNSVTAIKRDTLHKNDHVISPNSDKNFSEKTLPASTKSTGTSKTKFDSDNINKRVYEPTATVALNNSNSNKKIYKEENKSNKNLTDNAINNQHLPAHKNEVALPGNKSKVLQTNIQLQHFTNTTVAENNNNFYKDSTLSKSIVATNNSLPTIVNNNNIDSSFKQRDSIANTKHADSLTTKKQVKKSLPGIYKIPNWQYGVNVFYGRSSLTESIINFNKSLPAPLTITSVNPGMVDTVNSNKLYSSSTAYHIGAVVQKKILKNAVVGAGINYEHFSVKSHISGLVNSGFFLQYDNNSSAYVINNFYRPGNTSVYTNTYNFIELPVYFQQDIFHAKKVSFSYNAGFSIQQLLSSKSLIYNQANGIYYFKDGLLNKTQFQLQAGLNIKFNAGKSTSIYIGPQFSYSLTNNFKNVDDGTFHFINYGIHAGLLLHKK